MKMSLGKILQAKRQSLGISGAFIARKLNLSRQSISNKESGRTEFTFTEGLKYCNSLGMDIGELCEYLIFLDK